MKKRRNSLFIWILVAVVLSSLDCIAQQDAQYTQYMYNTLSINPAYAGSRGTISILGLHRSQWVGLEGAPRTQTVSIHSPIGKSKRVGLGLNIVNDEIFISNETYIDANFSYSLKTSERGRLNLGLKAGVQILDINYSEGSASQDGDSFLSTNIDNRFLPQVGIGLFYHTNKFYAGLSVPNLLETEHFDDSDDVNDPNSSFLARERINYYFTTGYVFDISKNFKFKPAGLVKWVSGSPLQVDISANALLYDRLTLGLAYRWSASFSALAGFRISKSLMIGFAYDRETTDLQQFNDGSYEVFLRFEIFNNPKRVLTPRFF